jgi:hypothetical protein
MEMGQHFVKEFSLEFFEVLKQKEPQRLCFFVRLFVIILHSFSYQVHLSNFWLHKCFSSKLNQELVDSFGLRLISFIHLYFSKFIIAQTLEFFSILQVSTFHEFLFFSF